jgi:tetratricopeptide (TPR) repeat protein
MSREIMKGISLEAQCLYRRARELKGRGQPDAAKKYLKQAVMVAPGFSNAFLELGNCCDMIGNYGEALCWYDRAIRIDPDHSGALFNKAAVLNKMGDTVKKECNTVGMHYGETTVVSCHVVTG